jgi:serine protease inhibitor
MIRSPSEGRCYVSQIQDGRAVRAQEPAGRVGNDAGVSTEHCRFAGMTGGRDLWTSAAVHKAYIGVDEKGTQAAAATEMTVMATAMPNGPSPTVFTTDHPFPFLIRDNRLGHYLHRSRGRPK